MGTTSSLGTLCDYSNPVYQQTLGEFCEADGPFVYDNEGDIVDMWERASTIAKRGWLSLFFLHSFMLCPVMVRESQKNNCPNS
jgi:hypothetical protein